MEDYSQYLIRKLKHQLIPGSNVGITEGNKQKAWK